MDVFLTVDNITDRLFHNMPNVRFLTKPFIKPPFHPNSTEEFQTALE